jgi:hypothetical protein
MLNTIQIPLFRSVCEGDELG